MDLRQIDQALAANVQVQTYARDCSTRWYAEAMESVRDLLDNAWSSTFLDAAVYAPNDPPRRPSYPRAILEYLPDDLDDFEVEGRFEAVADGMFAFGMHTVSQCGSAACTLHNPTPHHMRSWILLWNERDERLMRACPHSFQHPDPDQIPYWRSRGLLHRYAHDCDGCCSLA